MLGHETIYIDFMGLENSKKSVPWIESHPEIYKNTVTATLNLRIFGHVVPWRTLFAFNGLQLQFFLKEWHIVSFTDQQSLLNAGID